MTNHNSTPTDSLDFDPNADYLGEARGIEAAGETPLDVVVEVDPVALATEVARVEEGAVDDAMEIARLEAELGVQKEAVELPASFVKSLADAKAWGDRMAEAAVNPEKKSATGLYIERGELVGMVKDLLKSNRTPEVEAQLSAIQSRMAEIDENPLVATALENSAERDDAQETSGAKWREIYRKSQETAGELAGRIPEMEQLFSSFPSDAGITVTHSNGGDYIVSAENGDPEMLARLEEFLNEAKEVVVPMNVKGEDALFNIGLKIGGPSGTQYYHSPKAMFANLKEGFESTKDLPTEKE